jgi:hypothetical protein
VSIREDLQINNDWITFPGLEVIQNSVVGSVVLGDEDTDEYLTILNCNRQPLEETLGVDLVYYNHLHGSFVLVQYKRMTSEGNGKSVYRPDGDKNLQDEIRRMKDAMHAMERLEKEPIVDIFGYRLNDHPFYLKLCDSKVSVALDANMVAGMYLPLALWDLQMEWPHSRGPRGGRAFTFDNCIRRFNNGEFTSLLRRGWIGSAAECSEYLSTIIEQVLGSGRMLVLAATSPGEAARDYRRDGLGRFAAEDDPTGAM